MLHGSVLITGGAGTLGRAIIRRAHTDNWPCKITIFSTDAMKHMRVQSEFPEVGSIIGDIRDYDTLHNAMVGKDIVIHGAAVKHIPVSEVNSIDTFAINVDGSLNVARAALQLRVPKVIAISTDKACSPANAYGATKMLMEKTWQEYARLKSKTSFHLVRYGNVLESTGSVVEAWRKAIEANQPIKMTNPDMTRFWLSPAQAVDLVIKAMELESGHIYVSKMPALSIGKLAEYTVGIQNGSHRSAMTWPIETIPLRPGEKMHETLLTIEERDFATDYDDFFDLRPSTAMRGSFAFEGNELVNIEILPYTSFNPDHELTFSETRALLGM